MLRHWKNLALLTIALGHIVLCQTGCSTLGAPKPQLLNADRLPAFEYVKTRANNYYLTVYENAKPEDKRAVRNAILSNLMAVIDYNYNEFEGKLRADKTGKDLGADIVTLGLTAASTASGVNSVKTILSAIATGVVGANTSLDKNIFQNNTVQALQLQMRAMRAEREKLLIQGMKTPVSEYPLQAGIRDVIEYYYAGSLTRALQGLVEKTGAAANAAKDAAAEARK